MSFVTSDTNGSNGNLIFNFYFLNSPIVIKVVFDLFQDLTPQEYQYLQNLKLHFRPKIHFQVLIVDLTEDMAFQSPLPPH